MASFPTISPNSKFAQKFLNLKWRYTTYHACGETSVLYAIWFVILTTYAGGTSYQAQVIFGLALLLGGLSDPVTGPLADRYGRKRLLVTGALLHICGGILLLANLTFALVALGFILIVIAQACISGSYEALVVDNIRAWQVSNPSKVTNKIFSLGHSLLFAVRGLVGISAGFLFELSPLFPLVLILLFSMFRFAIICCEYEESFQKSSRGILSQLMGAIIFIKQHRIVVKIFVLYLLTVFSSAIPWTVFQPIVTKQGVSPSLTSLTFGCLSLAGAMGSLLVNRKPDLHKSLSFLMLGLSFSFISTIGLIAFHPYYSMILILVAGFFWPSFYLRYMNQLAHIAPDSIRATLVSLMNTLEWVLSALVSIFLAERIVVLV